MGSWLSGEPEMKKGWVETGSLVERSYLRSACREEGPGSDTGAMRTVRDLPNDIDLRVVGCRARERLAGEGGSPDFLNLKWKYRHALQRQNIRARRCLDAHRTIPATCERALGRVAPPRRDASPSRRDRQ